MQLAAWVVVGVVAWGAAVYVLEQLARRRAHYYTDVMCFHCLGNGTVYTVPGRHYRRCPQCAGSGRRVN